MDGNHPGNADPRPKRRREPDNPYEIFTVGIGTDAPRYYLRFREGSAAGYCLEIDRALFEALNRFELEDISHLNEVDNHYETRNLPGEALTARAVNQPETPEETALRHLEMEQLYEAMKRLPAAQYRRLVLYYFKDLTYEQIAEMEGCTKVAVKAAIDRALAALKKI